MATRFILTHVRITILAIVLLFVADNSHAAFFVKKTPAAQTTVAYSSPAATLHRFAIVRKNPSHNYSAVPGDDSYKGILALVFGSAGLVSLGVALAASLPGLLLPAFLFGVAGIVFGAMHKKANRRMGRVGLILGIADVALIMLFLVALIIALASFT